MSEAFRRLFEICMAHACMLDLNGERELAAEFYAAIAAAEAATSSYSPPPVHTSSQAT